MTETQTEIKWARRHGGHTATAADRWGREVRLTVRGSYGEWRWTAYEAGTGYEANGWQDRVLARGLEDTLRDAKYFAAAALERI